MASVDTTVSLAEHAAAGTDERFVNSEFYANGRQLDVDQQAAMLRDVAAQLVQQNRPAIQRLNYPDEVKELVQKEFEKIEKQVNDGPDEFFALSNFRLRSYLRILCFGRVPVGPEHLEVDGVPRHLLFRGGPRQALRFSMLLAKLGRLRPKPFYVLHLGFLKPGAFLLQYSSREQRKMFKRVAGCLELNPDILGLSAAAWWYDPALREHSDYLCYLREGWEQNGCQFFDYESSDQDKRLATTGSATRQKLFDEGKYHPKSFLVVWTRDSLLRWAKSN